MNRITLVNPQSGEPEIRDGEMLYKAVKRKLSDWKNNHRKECYEKVDMDTGEVVNTNHYGLVFTPDESSTLVHIMRKTRLRTNRLVLDRDRLKDDKEGFQGEINTMVKDVDKMVKELDDFSIEMDETSDKQIKKMEMIGTMVESQRKTHNLRVEAYEKEVSSLKWLLKRMNTHPLVKLIRRLPWVKL